MQYSSSRALRNSATDYLPIPSAVSIWKGRQKRVIQRLDLGCIALKPKKKPRNRNRKFARRLAYIRHTLSSRLCWISKHLNERRCGAQPSGISGHTNTGRFRVGKGLDIRRILTYLARDQRRRDSGPTGELYPASPLVFIRGLFPSILAQKRYSDTRRSSRVPSA